MLSFITTAKPFTGHSAIIQRNALKSWTLLDRNVEVILFGDDQGAAAIAQEFGLRHESYVQRNESGSKRLDFMLQRAQSIATHDLLCYINCDIILMDDFRRALQRVKTAHSRFLMVGRRWDMDICNSCDFSQPEWPSRLRTVAQQNGSRRTPDWIDYFVFTRGLYRQDMPPFVVGRVGWDNWLVWTILDAGHPVVDVSAHVLAVHQNHDYSYHPLGARGVWGDEESGQNYRLAGGWNHLRTIADATEVLRAGGLRSNPSRHWSAAKRYLRQAGRVLLYDVWHRIWFPILGTTRPLRTALGLRGDFLRRSRQKI